MCYIYIYMYMYVRVRRVSHASLPSSWTFGARSACARTYSTHTNTHTRVFDDVPQIILQEIE